MKFTGWVTELSDRADSVAVTVTNVRRKSASRYSEYGKELVFSVTHLQSRAFPIGRAVEITVKAKG